METLAQMHPVVPCPKDTGWWFEGNKTVERVHASPEQF